MVVGDNRKEGEDGKVDFFEKNGGHRNGISSPCR